MLIITKLVSKNEILAFVPILFNRNLECTYVLSNLKIYNHNISNFKCKSLFEHHIFFNQFQTYLLLIFITLKSLKFFV
jgi:hypothetical protein